MQDKESFEGQETQLVISIDGGADSDTRRVAEAMDWPFGKKRVVVHQTNLGLRKNVLFCGSLSLEYGSVVVLEDDLIPSNGFGLWVRHALKSVQGVDRIAGVSLYSYARDEISGMAFHPILDGSDAYYLQFPSSWGQVWTAAQWKPFLDWYQVHEDCTDLSSFGVHDRINRWSAHSWKKYFAAYLCDTDKYFLFPRESYVLQLSEKGIHHLGGDQSVGRYAYQTPVVVRGRLSFSIPTLESSLAVYDHFFEPLPGILKQLNNALANYDFDVDLRQSKSAIHFTKGLVLTTKRGSKSQFTALGDVIDEWISLARGLDGCGIALLPATAAAANGKSRLGMKLDGFLKGKYLPGLKMVGFEKLWHFIMKAFR